MEQGTFILNCKENLVEGNLVRADMYTQWGVLVRTWAGTVLSVRRGRVYTTVVVKDCLDTADPYAVYREKTYVFMNAHMVRKLPGTWRRKLVIEKGGPCTMAAVAGLLREALAEKRAEEQGIVDGLAAELKQARGRLAYIGKADRRLSRKYGGEVREEGVARIF